MFKTRSSYSFSCSLRTIVQSTFAPDAEMMIPIRIWDSIEYIMIINYENNSEHFFLKTLLALLLCKMNGIECVCVCVCGMI